MILLGLLLFVAPISGFCQVIETICQTHTDALIGPDRNDWSHNPTNQTPPVNESYLHNFGPPVIPCGLTSPTVTALVVDVEIMSINSSMDCANIPVFGNVLFGCTLSNTSVCPIEEDALSPGCSFGVGARSQGTYSLDVVGCGPAPSHTAAIGVDLVPSTHTVAATCPVNGMAITNGDVTLTYEICVTWTYATPCDDGDDCTTNDMVNNSCNCVGTPIPSCTSTTMLPCNDGDACTTNDMVTVESCDNTIVCVPCAGTSIPLCTSTTMLPCNDGDACTTNDMQEVETCDNTITCGPCTGTRIASCSSTTILSCNDGNPCTTNDRRIVETCNTSVECVPCAGTPIPSCTNTIMVSCNDGDACTVNDLQEVEVCNSNIICVPCAGSLLDSDGDGVCDADDVCPGGDDNIDSDNDGIPDFCETCTTGDVCDDNDTCTENDVYDANCNCVGTLIDSDGDGVCDEDDICAGDDTVDIDNDNIPDDCDPCITGSSCDDMDPCTVNDVYDVACNCAGTFADADGDGVCDADDICAAGDDNVDVDNDGIPDACDPCITGATCDDNDPCTVNDIYDAICNCAGTFADADNDGVCDADDVCANGDDTVDVDNDGIPDFCDPCITGTPCDDMDSCTENDVYDAACNCIGSFIDTDNDGVCDADDICAGGDDTIDTDNDGAPDFCDNCNTGETCNDNDPCTVNDVYDPTCNCVGIFADADNDGVCDADDVCAGGDDSIDTDSDGIPDFCDPCNTGASCNDNDPCTVNDIYDATCNCAGTFADADNDGVCDVNDICTGGDDTIDTDSDGIPDFCDPCNTGATCNDNDPCTINDVYDTTCNCVGTFADADNDGVCDANDICTGGDDTIDTDSDGIPDFCDPCNTGGTCDDNDSCTVSDVYDADCNCAGTFADADSDGVCDADDVCAGGDDTVDTDSDGIPDFCDPCNTGATCDDNDPCTVNDIYDAACNCAGATIDCDSNGSTTVENCNDNDANTINDTRTILDCDGSICMPCQGTPCNANAIIDEPSMALSCDALDFGVVVEGFNSSQGSDISYEWIYDNRIISDQQRIEVFEEGIYQLVVNNATTGCSDTSTYTLMVPTPDIMPQLSIVDENCDNDGSISVLSVNGGVAPYLYSINGSVFSPAEQYVDLTPGEYNLTVMDMLGCTSISSIKIAQSAQSVFGLGEDRTIFLGDSIQLDLLSSVTLDSIVWDSTLYLSCINCATPYAKPIHTTEFHVRAIGANGCEYEDDITVFVSTKRDLVYIATAFSPDQNGTNDELEIHPGPSVAAILEFKVFDRWGTQLFEKKNFYPNNTGPDWDGTFNGENLNRGIYPYFLRIQLKDGSFQTIRGSVTLMR